MNNELTIRDKLAMSLDKDLIPKLNDAAIKQVSKKYGLEWSDDDVMKQIKFALDYQAIIRYEYADSMLKVGYE